MMIENAITDYNKRQARDTYHEAAFDVCHANYSQFTASISTLQCQYIEPSFGPFQPGYIKPEYISYAWRPPKKRSATSRALYEVRCLLNPLYIVTTIF